MSDNIAPTLGPKPVSFDVEDFYQNIDRSNSYNERVWRAAHYYLQAGFSIIPFRVLPNNKGKLGYPAPSIGPTKVAKTGQKIDEWWHPETGKYPGYCIAIAHGGAAGTCALDLDVKFDAKDSKDVNGIEEYANIIELYADYDECESPATLMAMTPSGGRHLIFRHHPRINCNSQKYFEGVDTRGCAKGKHERNGGITFAPPCRKPGSEDDKFYEWAREDTAIIKMPNWMVKALNGEVPNESKIALQESYIQSAPGKYGEGRDRNIYMDLLRFVGAGYNDSEIWALEADILDRMDPPDAEMVKAKINQALASDARKSAIKRKETSAAVAELNLATNKDDNVLITADNLIAIIRSPLLETDIGDYRYDDFYQDFVLSGDRVSIHSMSTKLQGYISKTFRAEFPHGTIKNHIEEQTKKIKKHSNAARDYVMKAQSHYIQGEPDFYGSGRRGPGGAFDRLANEVFDFGNEKLHPGYSPKLQRVYKALLWFWLQGACSRACVPGCKLDMMLLLFGGQGIGKSTVLSVLCPNPDWFTDSVKDSVVTAADPKDQLQCLWSKIIAELPEFTPTKRGGKSADDRLKAFISCRVDEFRPAYGTEIGSYARTCSLAGTANNRDVLRDTTGSRRFLCIDHGDTSIKVGAYDLGVMDEIRESLWAELRDSFNEGELAENRRNDALQVFIPAKLQREQQAINDHHLMQLVGEDEILEWATDKTRFTNTELVAWAKNTILFRDYDTTRIIGVCKEVFQKAKCFKYCRNYMRTEDNGKKKKCSFWKNSKHPDENREDKGQKWVPPHWSKPKPSDPDAGEGEEF